MFNVAFSCIRDEFMMVEIGDLVKFMLKFLDDDEVMWLVEGLELCFLLLNIEDGLFDAEDVRRREAVILVFTSMNEGGDEWCGFVIVVLNVNVMVEKLVYDEMNVED